MEIYGDLAPESRTMASFSVPDDCCYLYDSKDFGGSVFRACLDKESYGFKEILLYKESFDNKMESWQCGEHVRAQFCKSKDAQCSKFEGEGGAGPAENR